MTGDIYLWCANILSCPFDTSCFCSALSIKTVVPSVLDQVLDLEYARKAAPKVI